MTSRSNAIAIGLCGIAVAGVAGLALAQPMSEQQIRCMQLQQELAASQGGSGGGQAGGDIDQQIAQYQRVFDGTKASMDDAGCFESFFIFGRGLVRSPKCLKMNDRLEDARRQLSVLQEQRAAQRGGGANRRRQAEVQAALNRSGCGTQATAPQQQQQRRSGGLFDFFNRDEEPSQDTQVSPDNQTPISRYIDPSGRYRAICVRLCDGFFYPVSEGTYASHLSQDSERCQSNCAAPAELYVYRNPGGSPENAISLSGAAYRDLPVAFKYRQTYVQGCSCKQAEYNPTEIEAANKKAEAEPAPIKGKAKKPAAQPAPQAAAPAPDTTASTAAAQPDGASPQLDIDVSGSVPKPVAPAAPPPQAAAAPEAAAPAPAPAPAAAPAEPAPQQAQQSTVIKKQAAPPPQ